MKTKNKKEAPTLLEAARAAVKEYGAADSDDDTREAAHVALRDAIKAYENGPTCTPDQSEKEKAYIARQGSGCPHCGPDADIEGEEVNIDSGRASQKITCQGCGAEWWDGYNLADATTADGEGV